MMRWFRIASQAGAGCNWVVLGRRKEGAKENRMKDVCSEKLHFGVFPGMGGGPGFSFSVGGPFGTLVG